jgi:uncharacterized RDD family membrane protein YckC
MDPAATVGFGPRFVGRLIDTGVGLVAAVGTTVVAHIVLRHLMKAGVVAPGWSHDRGGPLSLYGGRLLANMLGATVSTWLGSVSLGKVLLGMRVVRLQGGRCGFGAALQRELAYYVDSFFLGMVAYSAMAKGPEHQRIGDRWAGTVVVRSSAVSSPTRIRSGRIALALCAGFALQVGVAALIRVLHYL